MLAGGTHIDHVGMLRAGRTGRVLGFRPMAPSTVGTFLRTFTFGHIRQLEAVLSRTLARAWGLGAGPGKAPLVVDLDSTICEVHGKQKQGAAYGYTKELGYHPLLAARADTGEVLGARMRKGSAGSSRGVVRFVDELVANLRRAGAAGPTTVRADSGFWSAEADRPSRRPRRQVVDHRRPRIRCSRSDPSNRRHRMDRHRLHQQRPRPSRRNRIHHRPRQSETHRSPRRAPHPPHRHASQHVQERLSGAVRAPNNDCGPTGDTTHSSAPTPKPTPPPRTSSTAPTPSSSSPSATSKKAPDSNTSPQATTARTAHGSHAPCSPTTSATGPTRSPTRRQPRTAPAAPDSSPSPPYSSTAPAHPPCDTPPAGPGKHNSEPHSAPSGLCPDPPAKRHSPELDAPTQTQRRQPQTTPTPPARHAQTHHRPVKHTKPHPNNPTRPQPDTDPRTPRSPKANRWIQAK